MELWIFCHYASTPDQPYSGHYDLARNLAMRGHTTTIFASSFSHYRFQELRLQPGEKWKAEEMDGVRFVWIKTPSYSRNNWRRILNMVTYAWRAFWVAGRLKEKPKVVIGVTVHPLAALAAYFVSVLKGARFLFEVRDLWPLTLVQFGMLSERNPVVWMMKVLEKFLFRKAERVIMVWPRMDEYAASMGVSPEKFVWIPQGVDLARCEALGAYDGKASDPFRVMYCGGFVQNNAIHVILRAAQLYQLEGDHRVRFILVGGGQEKPNLERLAKDLNLTNVEFRDVVPKNELAKVMRDADAFLLCMQDLPQLYRYGISWNKLCDYLASGRPTVFSGSPGYNPVLEARAGVVVPAENPRALAEGIKVLVAMTPEERLRMGNNGRKYVREFHDITVLAERLESILLPSGPATGARTSA